MFAVRVLNAQSLTRLSPSSDDCLQSPKTLLQQGLGFEPDRQDNFSVGQRFRELGEY
jgi:hypothetical protein